MANGSIAKRYARALLNLGEESDGLDQINNDLQAFGQVLMSDEQLLFNALTNPVLRIDEKSDVLNAIFNKMGAEMNVYAANFIRLLLDKGRLALFFDIAKVFQEMADERAGRVRAFVQTAQKISALERMELQKTIAEASNVSPDNLMVEYEVNTDLIGGIVAKVGDTLYDASIRSRLQELKTSLL